METKKKCIYCKKTLPMKCDKNYHAKCKINDLKIEVEKPKTNNIKIEVEKPKTNYIEITTDKDETYIYI